MALMLFKTPNCNSILLYPITVVNETLLFMDSGKNT